MSLLSVLYSSFMKNWMVSSLQASSDLLSMTQPEKRKVSSTQPVYKELQIFKVLPKITISAFLMDMVLEQISDYAQHLALCDELFIISHVFGSKNI